MAVAKVILNGTTLIDTTQKTVTAGSMLNGVTALKNDGTDITGSIASKTSSDLTASGATVTAPAGYYASSASKSVSSGSATTPATTITANPSISVSSGGLITASVSASQSVTPTVSAGYVSSGTAGTVSVSGSATQQLSVYAGAHHTLVSLISFTMPDGPEQVECNAELGMTFAEWLSSDYNHGFAYRNWRVSGSQIYSGGWWLELNGIAVLSEDTIQANTTYEQFYDD